MLILNIRKEFNIVYSIYIDYSNYYLQLMRSLG